MSQVTSIQSEVDALNAEYEVYVRKLRTAWLSQNRVNSNDVYEVMRPEQRAEVHQRIAQWGRYITPLAEAWWKERGYGVIWPEDDSKPMQVYRLEAA
jgi:hypothetical protein